jgi:hypothetical protein
VLNIPNLPTDNLCKFRALAGLSLVIVSIAALILLSQHEIQHLTLQAEILAQDRYIENRSKLREDLKKIAKFDTTGKVRRIIDEDGDSLIVWRNRLNERVFVEKEMRPFRGDLPFNLIWKLLLFVTLPSFVYTYLAFGDWKKNHQLYQDRLLIAQMKMAELDVEKAKAALKHVQGAVTVHSEAT